MRLLELYLFALVVAGAVLALSPKEIIDSLDYLTSQANETTPIFNAIIAQTGNLSANVLESKRLLDQTTAAYLNFYVDLTENPGDIVLDEAVSAQVAQAADVHSKTFSTMGIALARSLPAYDDYGYYDDGCKDGVEIGLQALTLFADLALKFPSDGIAIALSGLLTVLRVPLAQLSAVGCFVPILGPLPTALAR